MVNRLKSWFERFLEEPFYRAELNRAEMSKEGLNIDIMASLAGSLSHNYQTLKSWSK